MFFVEKSEANGSKEAVISELESIAFSNIGRYISKNESDGEEFILKSPSEVSERDFAAVAQIKGGSKGFEVKLYNKLRALEILARYYLGDNSADTEDMTEQYGEVFGDVEDT